MKIQHRKELLQANGHIAVGACDGILFPEVQFPGRLNGRGRQVCIFIDILEDPGIIRLGRGENAAGKTEYGKGIKSHLAAELVKRHDHAGFCGSLRTFLNLHDPVGHVESGDLDLGFAVAPVIGTAEETAKVGTGIFFLALFILGSEEVQHAEQILFKRIVRFALSFS